MPARTVEISFLKGDNDISPPTNMILAVKELLEGTYVRKGMKYSIPYNGVYCIIEVTQSAIN